MAKPQSHYRIWSKKRNQFFRDFSVDEAGRTHEEWDEKAQRAQSFLTFATAELLMRSLAWADGAKVSDYEVLN